MSTLFHLNLAAFLSAAVLPLASCRTVRPAAAAALAPPPRYEFIEDIPMESTAGVQRAADIRAYPVGRYVDAANRDVMHERHIIYRRERPEQWRLNSDRGPAVLLGPAAGLRNPVALSSPAPQELTAELNRQRLVTRQLLEIKQKAGSGDEQARALLSKAAAMQENQEKLMTLIMRYNERMDVMQRKLDSIPADRAAGAPEPAAAAPPPAPAPAPASSPKLSEPAPSAGPEVSNDDFKPSGFILPWHRR